MGREWGIIFMEKGSQEDLEGILDSLCYNSEKIIEDLDEEKIAGEDGYNITRIIEAGKEKEFMAQRVYASLQGYGGYRPLEEDLLLEDLYYGKPKLSGGPFVDNFPLGTAISGAQYTGLISWLPISEVIRSQGKTEERFLRYDLKLIKDFEDNWVTASIQSGEFGYYYSESITRGTPEGVDIRDPKNEHIRCFFQDDESLYMSMSEAFEAGFFETKEAVWFLYHV